MNYCPTVDVIIPCYNVEHVVKKCVNSIIAQEYGNTVKIYLINDGSTDNTPNILESFSNNTNITVILHEQNRGLSTARNAGINAGRGEVICFLDSDMVVKQNWIESHILVLSEKGIIGVIGDIKLPETEVANPLDKYLYDKRRGARQIGEKGPIKFTYFLFSNTSIKRIVFQKIDLFDEIFSSYGGEDTDLAIRLWEVYPESLHFSSKAVSEHHSKQKFNEFCNSMYNYGMTNFLILIKKYPQYKYDLGGQYINSISGYVIFNPITRFAVNILGSMKENYWLKRYLVVDSVIRGARRA